MRILVVGAGFSGAVIARELSFNSKVLSIDVFESRPHIGGNCHTERDAETGIMIHKYGPHIFNTSNEVVWNYINQFDEFMPYKHQVKIKVKNQIFSMPINLHTINQFFNTTFSPDEAKKFISQIAENIEHPKNFEEQALSFIGKELYDSFFKGYTKKQWGCDPKEIPASVLKRLPVRFNYDDSYYTSKFVGIPKNGYTYIIKKILGNPKINIYLNKYYRPEIHNLNYDHIIYTGPIDRYFDYKYGRLGYRTVTFEANLSDGDFQGCSQMNYGDEDVDFTRITEHKHFNYWEEHNKTIFFKEFSKETEKGDEPFYPKRLQTDIKIFDLYSRDAAELEKVHFLGRLATYRYMDMHNVISEALDLAKKFNSDLF